ncbi:hypothetical protein [Streptomyces sp. NPDC048603]|uniref:isoamylase early set domain-containing protein n=1 Tax=Streptomyces sp. NPDC048603 TaxID=3365577 RepID=UPI00371742E6
MIGAGSGNAVVDDLFADVDVDVAVVEGRWFGGTCLNAGCIPSKMLAYTAKVAHTVRQTGTHAARAARTRTSLPCTGGRARFTGPRALRIERAGLLALRHDPRQSGDLETTCGGAGVHEPARALTMAESLSLPAARSLPVLERTLKKDRIEVTFILPGDTPPGPVSVVGDFNDWQPGVHTLKLRKDGKRAVTVELPPAGSHSFRYLAAGDYWFNDDSAGDQDGPNSLLHT